MGERRGLALGLNVKTLALQEPVSGIAVRLDGSVCLVREGRGLIAMQVPAATLRALGKDLLDLARALDTDMLVPAAGHA